MPEPHLRNKNKITKLNKLFQEYFTDQLYYGDNGRQMILNDILEYIFTARGYFYMWNTGDIENKKNFVKIVLHFINQLMILESISVDHELRNVVLDSLENEIGEKDFFRDENSISTFQTLMSYEGDVHFDTANTNIPDDIKMQFDTTDSDKQILKIFDNYTDSLLPKLPHGLWRELIVYIQLLRINAGFILPLLLNQRIVSKNDYLKPPDFLIIKENGDLIGVEVGAGKETQVSNFSVKMKCQMVTAHNSNIPPRCPICGKWILFCDKVIEEFSDLDNPLLYIYDDIRCAHDCNIYSYEQVLSGECPYVKYRGKINSTTKHKQNIKFATAYHYHYSCILKMNDSTANNEIKRQKDRWEKHLLSRGSIVETSRRMTINCLKTNYPYFDGISELENFNKDNLKCYSKYLKNKNCEICKFKENCRRLSIIIPLIDSTVSREKLKEEINKLI